MYSAADKKRTTQVTISTLAKMKREAEKIVMLTSYDASFAKLCSDVGVDVILVGDSLGNVIQGKKTTIPVTLDEIIYHTNCVMNGNETAFVIADMPFMSYANLNDGLDNAGRIMKESGAHMVKLEGGKELVELVKAMAVRGIPVCGHLGLMPQSVHKMGGYKVQGREQEEADHMVAEALALQEAGIDMLVLECVPAVLAKRIAAELAIPVIGIGAGVDCDGQVLVLQDMLAITPGKRPKFSKDFMAGAGSIAEAMAAYVKQVKNKEFPAQEHTF
ncbi:MAG: 3-methyl-2-oxobutanoate hydroxymethyltransferase [Gammaproteobacteria bacterium]|nr:MAG: 3-methyl-2-oxobutanoate hydroxymethyltransferase [Gammaproteobacteria bacterium]